MQFLARVFVSNPPDGCAETSFISRIISSWLKIECIMYFLEYILVIFKKGAYYERLCITFKVVFVLLEKARDVAIVSIISKTRNEKRTVKGNSDKMLFTT